MTQVEKNKTLNDWHKFYHLPLEHVLPVLNAHTGAFTACAESVQFPHLGFKPCVFLTKMGYTLHKMKAAGFISPPASGLLMSEVELKEKELGAALPCPLFLGSPRL